MNSKEKSSPKKDNYRGKYANYFKVGFNAYEFIIDFCQYYPENDSDSETEKAELCERFITSPAYAKSLVNVLSKSINEYEAVFGFIEEDQNGSE
jgi:hypothetical protein